MLRLFRDNRGESAISYALIVAVVAFGIIVGLTTIVGSEGDQTGILGVLYNVRASICNVPAMACSP